MIHIFESTRLIENDSNRLFETLKACKMFLRCVQMRTQTLQQFLLRVEAGYEKYGNPYHNQTHAADVTQTTHHVIVRSGLAVCS